MNKKEEYIGFIRKQSKIIELKLFMENTLNLDILYLIPWSATNFEFKAKLKEGKKYFLLCSSDKNEIYIWPKYGNESSKLTISLSDINYEDIKKYLLEHKKTYKIKQSQIKQWMLASDFHEKKTDN